MHSFIRSVIEPASPPTMPSQQISIGKSENCCCGECGLWGYVNGTACRDKLVISVREEEVEQSLIKRD